MSGSERPDGPFTNLSQAYFGGFDQLMRGYEPALRGVGRLNLELMGLMTRRTKAWLDIPMRMSQCKTPQELVSEQLRFWQTAAHDYADGSKRLAGALGACAVVPGLNGAWGSSVVGQTRDYITVPEAKTTGGEPERRSKDRKAA